MKKQKEKLSNFIRFKEILMQIKVTEKELTRLQKLRVKFRKKLLEEKK